MTAPADLAVPLWTFHLGGKHDQLSHGKGGFGERIGSAAKGDAALKAVAYKPSGPGIQAGLDAYGGEGPDSYSGINSGLREGTVLSPGAQANADAFDEAMRQVPGAPSDLVVYRTVRHDAFGLSNEQWLRPDNDLTGLVWHDKGFVSTATGSEWQADTSQIAMRMLVPKGTKALSYHRKGGGLDSDEILINRDHRFRVVADHGFRKKNFRGEPDPFSGRDIDVEVFEP